MILPENIQTMLKNYQGILETWFSEQLYRRFVSKHTGHLLVQLNARLKLDEVEKACAGYYHQSGAGRPVWHGIKRLVRGVLVRSLYGYSLRETEQAINGNLFIKWYVGYGVFESGPDHSTLEDFELWLLREKKRLLFDEVLRQIEEDYPEERGMVQIGDTYAMEANAARENLVPRLRHASERLLREYQAAGWVDHGNSLSGMDWLGLFGSPKEVDEVFLDKAKRQMRLQTTVLAVLNLLGRVEQVLAGCPSTEYPLVRLWVGYMRKIITDECQVVEGKSVTELRNKDKGDFRIISTTDPEATFRKHGEAPEDTVMGYNVQLAATASGFIRETQAYTGATPDQSGIPDLVAVQQEEQGCCPDKIVYDSVAGTGKCRDEVAQASAGQTQIVAKLLPYDVRSRFGPYDFILSEDGQTLTCPNGKCSTAAYTSPTGDGRNFRFYACQCWQGEVPTRMKTADCAQRCPLWEQCRDSRQGPGAMRQVFISDYRQQVLDAQIFNQSAIFKLYMKLRPRIERVIFELTAYNGARRCTRRGLAAADFQAKMAATAYNLKLWLRKLNLSSRPRRSWRVPGNVLPGVNDAS